MFDKFKTLFGQSDNQESDSESKRLQNMRERRVSPNQEEEEPGRSSPSSLKQARQARDSRSAAFQTWNNIDTKAQSLTVSDGRTGLTPFKGNSFAFSTNPVQDELTQLARELQIEEAEKRRALTAIINQSEHSQSSDDFTIGLSEANAQTGEPATGTQHSNFQHSVDYGAASSASAPGQTSSQSANNSTAPNPSISGRTTFSTRVPSVLTGANSTVSAPPPSTGSTAAPVPPSASPEPAAAIPPILSGSAALQSSTAKANETPVKKPSPPAASKASMALQKEDNVKAVTSTLEALKAKAARAGASKAAAAKLEAANAEALKETLSPQETTSKLTGQAESPKSGTSAKSELSFKSESPSKHEFPKLHSISANQSQPDPATISGEYCSIEGFVDEWNFSNTDSLLTAEPNAKPLPGSGAAAANTASSEAARERHDLIEGLDAESLVNLPQLEKQTEDPAAKLSTGRSDQPAEAAVVSTRDIVSAVDEGEFFTSATERLDQADSPAAFDNQTIQSVANRHSESEVDEESEDIYSSAAEIILGGSPDLIESIRTDLAEDLKPHDKKKGAEPKSELIQPESTLSEPTKSEPIQSEPIQPESSLSEPSKPEPTRPNQSSQNQPCPNQSSQNLYSLSLCKLSQASPNL